MEALSKLSEKCKACPMVDKCGHKRMELCAYMELPKQVSACASQSIANDLAMPLMRERIESPLSPFTYKDELEKALHKELYKGLGLMYGV